MAIFKSRPVDKYIDGTSRVISEYTVVTDAHYTSDGETAIVIKDVEECILTLNHETTKHVTIKSLTNTLVISSEPIDDEFSEIYLGKGACVELRFIIDRWYIMSSDGLKGS
jgi:hypothetical protein